MNQVSALLIIDMGIYTRIADSWECRLHEWVSVRNGTDVSTLRRRPYGRTRLYGGLGTK